MMWVELTSLHQYQGVQREERFQAILLAQAEGPADQVLDIYYIQTYSRLEVIWTKEQLFLLVQWLRQAQDVLTAIQNMILPIMFTVNYVLHLSIIQPQNRVPQSITFKCSTNVEVSTFLCSLRSIPITICTTRGKNNCIVSTQQNINNTSIAYSFPE